VIGALDLPELHKRLLNGRWLDQLLWIEGAAERANRWHHGMRLVMIVGGILIPALLSLNLQANLTSPTFISWLGFGLGLLVAISAGLEEFFKFGERWRHYRRLAEMLKSEGWQFFQMTGPYRRHESQLLAYPSFAARVELLFRQEVDAYITEVVSDKDARKATPSEQNGTLVGGAVPNR
jgi:hypothetical protein